MKDKQNYDVDIFVLDVFFCIICVSQMAVKIGTKQCP